MLIVAGLCTTRRLTRAYAIFALVPDSSVRARKGAYLPTQLTPKLTLNLTSQSAVSNGQFADRRPAEALRTRNLKGPVCRAALTRDPSKAQICLVPLRPGTTVAWALSGGEHLHQRWFRIHHGIESSSTQKSESVDQRKRVEVART